MRSIALIDVNNFYASCERVFNPRLEGKPVAILSNNDGCVIARNAASKMLGLPMGAPWFKFKGFAKYHGIIALSSNYALYADMSNRVMNILSQYSPNQEIYSIDECFLDLTGINTPLTDYAQDMRGRVKQWIGLPVCVGIGSSKTLAKLANHIAKKQPEYNGVCNLNTFSAGELFQVFSALPLAETWGIGRKLIPKLNKLGIHTVQDLRSQDPEYMRKEFSVVIEKTVKELNGIACLELDEITPPRRQIISSRSFGYPVTDFASLSESITLYTSRAAEKLRRQHSYANALSVFIRTSSHTEESRKYSNSITMALPYTTNDTMQLVNAGLKLLKAIYKPGYRYQKAGVVLSGISVIGDEQDDLFSAMLQTSKAHSLMAVMDKINAKMGKQHLRLASQGYQQPWKMKQEHKSPHYTTNWNELLNIHL